METKQQNSRRDSDMIIKDTSIIIDDAIEKKLIYRALEDLRMNDMGYSKYHQTLDTLIYNLKKHLYCVNSSRFLSRER